MSTHADFREWIDKLWQSRSGAIEADDSKKLALFWDYWRALARVADLGEPTWAAVMIGYHLGAVDAAMDAEEMQKPKTTRRGRRKHERVLWLALTAGSLGIELPAPDRSEQKRQLKDLWKEKFGMADSTWRKDYREAVARNDRLVGLPHSVPEQPVLDRPAVDEHELRGTVALCHRRH